MTSPAPFYLLRPVKQYSTARLLAAKLFMRSLRVLLFPPLLVRLLFLFSQGPAFALQKLADGAGWGRAKSRSSGRNGMPLGVHL
jgi:hypothetical protein